MNKFDRVISILVLLQTKNLIKASTIAERFDISLRTVYRDISTLKKAGIPIIGDPGIGYSMMEGYRIPPIMFNEWEASALLTAEKVIGKLTDKETEAHYSSAMMKIKSILRSTEKQSLAVLDDSILISENKTGENRTFLQEIFNSITNKQILKINYQKADGSSSKRSLEPIGCYHKFNNWYLVAYCQKQKDYRTFKLKRIKSCDVSPVIFDTKHINLQKYMDQQNDNWKAEQEFYSIEIAFNLSYVKFAEGRKYYFGFVDQTVKDEQVYMKFLNTSIEVIARWLLQFGDQAIVISPPVLKERMKVLAKQLYANYK